MRKLAWSSFVLGAVVLVGGIRCGSVEHVVNDGTGGSGFSGAAGAAGMQAHGGRTNGGGGSRNGTAGTGEGGALVTGYGGAAGKAADPFADAPEAEWEPFGTFGTCPVDRLIDPGQHTLLYWEPCGAIEGCGIAVMNPHVLELTDQLGTYPEPNSSITGDGGTFFGLVFQGVQSYVIFAEADGHVIDGFRNTQVAGEDFCLFGGAPVSGESYAFVIASSVDTPVIPLGGMIFARDSREQRGAMAIDDTVTGPPGDWVFSNDRLGTTYVFPTRQASLSATDGGDFRLFATSTGVITDMGEMITTGPQFLFTAITTESPPIYIMASDGIEPPTPYIRADDGSYTGAVGYAHSRIVWQKGINPESANRFERVEVWASEYDPNPEKLEPYKVADSDLTGMATNTFAGWGHYATSRSNPDTGDRGLRIWNVLTLTQRDYTIPESFRRMRRFIGMTPEHLYVTADHVQGLLRFEIE